MLHQLEKKKKKNFGKTTERHNPRHRSGAESEPGDLGFEDIMPDTDQHNQKGNQQKKHKKNINQQDISDVVRKHTVKPESRFCPECLVEMQVVGHKVSKQLESLQQSVVRLQHQQEVLACQKCHDHVAIAEKPAPPFPGSLAGPHLLGNIIVNRLANGLPNYRQHKIFKRQLCIVPRSTM